MSGYVRCVRGACRSGLAGVLAGIAPMQYSARGEMVKSNEMSASTSAVSMVSNRHQRTNPSAPGCVRVKERMCEDVCIRKFVRVD